MNYLLLEYPKCSTCQKAKKWLTDHDVAFDSRHIAEHKPSAAELQQWQSQSGQPLKKFFNTSGLKYKALNCKELLPNMTEQEQIELLASDGMLVKRPLLIGNGKILIGFREKEWETELK